MNKIKQSMKNLYQTAKPSLIAVAIGLLSGLVIMFIFSPIDAFPALFTLILGGFNGGIDGIGDMLYAAAPIIFTGLSVAFAFKTGLFNIGASGQMMVGAYVAVHIGVLATPGAFPLWIIALLAGALAGAIWGLVPGLLKAIANVNEVVTSIMMNYIAGYLVIYLINTYILSLGDSASRVIQNAARIPVLDFIFPGSSANLGIVLALGFVIIIHIILHKTILGFQLRASGFSFDGSKYAGMNTKTNIVIAMTISGLLAGIAGATAFLVAGKQIPARFNIFTEGFDGISVALLGLGEPIGALFAGLFLSNLREGGFYMQLYPFVPQIIDMVISVIIYATAISVAIQALIKRYGERFKAWRNSRKDQKGEAE
jgi:simple sugar transport system permease protein